MMLAHDIHADVVEENKYKKLKEGNKYMHNQPVIE